MTTRISFTWPAVPGAKQYTIQNGRTKVQSALPTVHGLAVANGDSVVVTVSAVTPPPPAAAGNGVGAVRLAGTFDPSEDLSWADVILVTNLDESVGTPAKYPSAKTYVYCSMASISQSQYANNVIPWQTAHDNGWLLKDSGDPTANPPVPPALLFNKGYPSNNILDITNPAVGDAIGDGLVALCRQHGFASGWIDDVDMTCTTLCNAMPAGMSQAQWQAGITTTLTRLAAKLKAAGFARPPANVYAFIGDDGASNDGTLIQQFVAQVLPTGCDITIESWMQWPDGSGDLRPDNTEWYGYWSAWRAIHAQVAAVPGAAFFPSATNDAGALYCRATSLLDDGPCYTVSVIGDGPWTAKVSSPTAGASKSGTQWSRPFAVGGTVKVDPTSLTASL